MEYKGTPSSFLIKAVSESIPPEKLARLARDSIGSFAFLRRNSDHTFVLLTDSSGSIPIYYTFSNGRPVAEWNPFDVVKHLRNVRFDPVSLADLLLHGTVCYPHTLFEGVFVAPPGSVSILSGERLKSIQYFVPAEQHSKSEHGVDDWPRMLRETLRKAIVHGLSDTERIKVLYSGGVDSRAIVSLLPRDIDCQLVTLADLSNREVSLAKRAAHLQERDHIFLRRPEGFYHEDLQARTRMTGGVFDISHTHVFPPLSDFLAQSDAVVGGFAADTLFKSTWMQNVHKSRFGLGPDRLEGQSALILMPRVDTRKLPGLKEDVAAAVVDRRYAHRDRIAEFRPLTAGNWQSCWPLGTQQQHYGYYLSCLSLLPKIVEPFMDSGTYAVAAALPDEYRIDQRILNEAFRSTLGPAGWAPTTSGRIPFLRGYTGHWASRIIKTTRRIGDTRHRLLHPKSRPNQGPWTPKRRYLPWDTIHWYQEAFRSEIEGIQGSLFDDVNRHNILTLKATHRFRLVQLALASLEAGVGSNI